MYLIRDNDNPNLFVQIESSGPNFAWCYIGEGPTVWDTLEKCQVDKKSMKLNEAIIIELILKKVNE